MGKIVLDASVVLKLFLEEEYTDLVELLLEKFQENNFKIYVPQIFFFEIVNVLKTKSATSSKDVVKVINNIFKLNFISQKADQKLLLKANYYAQKYNLSIYDASYVALAKILGVNLITTDNKLVKKINLKFVKFLGDLSWLNVISWKIF